MAVLHLLTILIRYKLQKVVHPLKKLIGQTALYGVSSIVGRFLNYLLVPLYTHILSQGEYGAVSELYAYSGFLGVLLTFGMETGYFRFSRTEDSDRTYSTALIFLTGVSLLFMLLVYVGQPILAHVLHYEDHAIYFVWFACLLAFDTIGAIPFARLRQEQRPLFFAGIKFIEIAINIGLNLFFIWLCKPAFDAGRDDFFAHCYSPAIGAVGYIFLANLIASGVKLLLLSPWLGGMLAGFDRAIFRLLLPYALPMVIIGLAGVTNEMIDRAMLPHLLTGTIEQNRAQTGIYGACYKISIAMSLFIQAFRFAAEPFFFTHEQEQGSRQTFADVMKWFVIFCSFIFLVVMLGMDVIQHFIGAGFRAGLGIVPILLLANLCLGIYVNLSIWYKLTDRTMMGAAVSVAGALLTILLNLWWIPILGYMGSAYATLVCYGSMAVVSYILGQRYFSVPYPVGKILGYIGLVLGLYLIHHYLLLAMSTPVRYAASSAMLLSYLTVVWWVDGRDFSSKV
jgi:O-antigen/teichoic acid export membrane protein